MGKQQKKKRNKRYTGQDAATVAPRVTKVVVPDRSKLTQWFVENKKVLRARAIFFALIFALLWLFTSLITWIF